ncbi:MAG: thioredoxin domain-containing protein [Candidatus Kerfeldbacteria bacterium]|nr:thioredoxin domain-containing protein [Candidatus Kerfeldbacteria bacterium]
MEHPAPHPTPTPKLVGSIWQGTSPQLAFIFGVIAGVAAATLVSIFILLPRASGATKKSAATTTPTNSSTTSQPSYGNVKVVGDDDYVRGSPNAKLTLIEYSDYECPFCKSFHPTMQQVMTDYKDQVAWVYRHFPLSFHANAAKEAEAGLCVGSLGDSNAFWDFTDKIFERTASNGTGFSLEQLPALAKEVGVNESKFKDCLDSGQMAARVQAETADGTNAGAGGTPTTFVVGRDGKTITVFPGALPYSQVKTELDRALASG